MVGITCEGGRGVVVDVRAALADGVAAAAAGRGRFVRVGGDAVGASTDSAVDSSGKGRGSGSGEGGTAYVSGSERGVDGGGVGGTLLKRASMSSHAAAISSSRSEKSRGKTCEGSSLGRT